MGQARLGNMGLRNNAACTVQPPAQCRDGLPDGAPCRYGCMDAVLWMYVHQHRGTATVLQAAGTPACVDGAAAWPKGASRLQAGTPQALGKPAFKGLDWRMRPQGQGAGKAHNCGNCPDKRGTGGNFPCICPLHLHPAATYVHVGPLDASQLPWLASFPNALPACPLCQHPEEAGAPLVPPYQGGWAAAGFACARGLPADAGSRFCAAAPARLPGTVFLCTGLGRLTICR